MGAEGRKWQPNGILEGRPGLRHGMGGRMARGTQTCNFHLSDVERAEGGRPRVGCQKYQVGLWCEAPSLKIV